MRYFLENDELKVEIDSFGAEVKSIINKRNNREYMWYGNPNFWGRTSPVLFPFVGSLAGKRFIHKGKEYPMKQHGFARDMEHTLTERTDNIIWFELNSNAETLAKYPFNFKLNIGYKLMNNRVEVMWKVSAPKDSELLFSIGAHPAFLCPVHGEKSKEGYFLRFDSVDELHYYGHSTETGLAKKEDIVLRLEDGRVRITEDFFDTCAYMIGKDQTHRVTIEDRSMAPILSVDFDASLFALWSPEGKNAPFICIEPWYGRCDREGFNGTLAEREYTQKLNPGEVFTASYGMTFYKI